MPWHPSHMAVLFLPAAASPCACSGAARIDRTADKPAIVKVRIFMAWNFLGELPRFGIIDGEQKNRATLSEARWPVNARAVASWFSHRAAARLPRYLSNG